ncbi:MAG: hypothetical protein MJ233_02805 [Mycoplasmoidaceae bacterium]|nr:hypothetical protein [Mycoplasmoidaceae bacterium]
MGEYEADTGFSDSLFIAAATGILNFPSYYLGMTTTARHIDTLDVPLSYRYGEEQADSGDNNVYLGG